MGRRIVLPLAQNSQPFVETVTPIIHKWHVGRVQFHSTGPSGSLGTSTRARSPGQRQETWTASRDGNAGRLQAGGWFLASLHRGFPARRSPGGRVNATPPTAPPPQPANGTLAGGRRQPTLTRWARGQKGEEEDGRPAEVWRRSEGEEAAPVARSSSTSHSADSAGARPAGLRTGAVSGG